MTYSIGKYDPKTGKADVTVADVAAALALPPDSNPLGHVRNLLGDTLSTRIQVDVYNGTRDYIGCGENLTGITPGK
jgi:hypothetical protein